jgi:hypothetical protein
LSTLIVVERETFEVSKQKTSFDISYYTPRGQNIGSQLP